MARRKKKKQSFSKSLKYEIYGILLITCSVIALSGGAAFGRSLSKISGLLLGKWYFIIPLTFIYIGLAVMIKRNWPKGWNPRKTGMVCIILALTMISTVHAVEQRILPVADEVGAGFIFQDIHKTLKAELLQAQETGTAGTMLQKDISGGYVGAVLYCALFMLFGSLGSKLLTIVLLFIGFMLATQLSYVELVRLLRSQIKKLAAVMKKKRKARLNERKLQDGKQQRAAAKHPVKEYMLPDSLDDEEDEDGPPRRIPKMPIFMQLFSRKRAAENADEDEEYGESAIFKGRAKAARLSDADDEDDGPIINAAVTATAAKASSELQNGHGDLDAAVSEAPRFRDFTAQAAESGRADQEDQLPEHVPAAGQSPWKHDDTEDDWEEAVPGALAHQGGADSAHAGLDPEVVQAPDGAEGIAAEPALIKPPPPPVKPYKMPSFNLLSKQPNSAKGGDQADFMQTARKLEATLESFGVRAKVLEVVRGPAVTRYEIQPDIGVKVSRIVSLSDDIALALAAKDIRMEAPIPGKSAIGIEVPNNEVSTVTMREVMETPTFLEAASRLSIALGRDISGTPIVGNLARMPHLLVAGATGSGKSVCINGIITSILYKAKPDEVKFLMVDPKMVELNVYNGIPHLLAPVVTDPRRASLALKKIVVEMEKRYELFSKSGTRNIEGYNKLVAEEPEKVLPYIVIIVDELADLMMVAANDVEDAICRLAQMARAAGIHLIIATQRPSVDVITGVIKANIPSRIAFGVSSQVDSRTILDMAGAEKLLGRGDMLFLPMGSSKPIRVQGAFLSDQEVESVVSFVSGQGQAEYNDDLVPEIDENGLAADEPIDELYEQAIQMVLEAQQASASLLQRRMRIGYNRASRLIDHMHMQGIIGPHEGSRPREVLLTLEQYQQNKISS
ncbi:FtsK/SpoIIIE family DNA translocase [Paenibacillus apiarius]|uniref:DNA translocase FtsK n=1 Tax=Paenibacillus apiarius TaxID=46240 RepID=A0ABT4DM75_9BACL|nr:DNA translocase FtsK [Paenibacillus apiarius]MCY9516112.1 DNA translocase FtsK [Paenibacillus apiarius]MCY9518429.1 DNA translocase FtsK [Paenibacillus apiarius]MCY9551170.1 DNA translocase FtsK [Paenibacillus apiarius]MCY9558324.1 DNA translocase FtsK [Paenibacillus apiarius]MCY9684724.1 DNA translocase FtsK [Paenibacillus apiarius]